MNSFEAWWGSVYASDNVKNEFMRKFALAAWQAAMAAQQATGSGGRTTTSTLHLACPTCGDEIEVEYEVHCADCWTDPVSVRTWCFHPISKVEAYDLLLDYGARQAELATERAGERP